MIYHQIRFSMKPDVPPEELEASLERLRALGRKLDVVQSWVVGRDFGGEFEYGALYTLPDPRKARSSVRTVNSRDPYRPDASPLVGCSSPSPHW
jgi:Stress responsive A/B Barrel Domain